MRRLLFIVVSILVSLGFLYLVLRDVPLAEVWEQLQSASLPWMMVALILQFAGLWVRAWRWRSLLDDRIGQKDAFYIIGITFLLNQLPLRAGEVARSVLARRYDVPVVTAATSIVVERLLDTVLVVLLLAAALANVPNVPTEVNQTAALFGALATGGFGFLLVLAHLPHRARALLNGIMRLLPFLERLPLRSMFDNVLMGLAPLTHWRKLSTSVGLTLLAWLLSAWTLTTLHLALDITDVDLTLSTVLGLTLASFSIAIPISVAAIGPFQAALVITGQMVNMAEIKAVALGLLFHGVSILGYVIWGVVGLMVMGVSLGELRHQPAQTTPTQQSAP